MRVDDGFWSPRIERIATTTIPHVLAQCEATGRLANFDNAAEALRRDWEHMLPGVPLVVIETPYRSLVTPFLHYLDVMAPTPPDTITVVVLPEYVPRHWWDRFLHNQKAEQIGEALIGRHNTVVATVPYGAERKADSGARAG